MELSSKLNTEVFLQLLASCMEEVKLWRVRLPRRDANLAETWTGVLRAGMLISFLSIFYPSKDVVKVHVIPEQGLR
jgi:hypothetical protein